MASFYGGGACSTGGNSGTSGTGIANIEIDTRDHLIVYLTDGSKKDLGRIKGATFTPAVVDGILIWANDQGLENPEAFDFSSLMEEEGEMWFPVDETPSEEQPSEDTSTWERI